MFNLHGTASGRWNAERSNIKEVDRHKGKCIYYSNGKCQALRLVSKKPNCAYFVNVGANNVTFSENDCRVKGKIIEREKRYRPESITQN
jgi:hypothetical protein